MTGWRVLTALMVLPAAALVALTAVAMVRSWRWRRHVDSAVAVGNGMQCLACRTDVEDMNIHRRLRHTRRYQPLHEQL